MVLSEEDNQRQENVWMLDPDSVPCHHHPANYLGHSDSKYPTSEDITHFILVSQGDPITSSQQ